MRINEIFYSIQGEGYWTGRPAVFVRFSGCNLNCPFCDTDFRDYEEMDEDWIVNQVSAIGGGCKFVVLTGGEPTLQLTGSLISKLHSNGYYIAIETNGTNKVLAGVDWITCSPKVDYCKNGGLSIERANEVKMVYTEGLDVNDPGIPCDYKYLQPCDMGFLRDNSKNIKGVVRYCMEHPEWRISLQTQKILKVR